MIITVRHSHKIYTVYIQTMNLNTAHYSVRTVGVKRINKRMVFSVFMTVPRMKYRDGFFVFFSFHDFRFFIWHWHAILNQLLASWFGVMAFTFLLIGWSFAFKRFNSIHLFMSIRSFTCDSYDVHYNNRFADWFAFDEYLAHSYALAPDGPRLGSTCGQIIHQAEWFEITKSVLLAMPLVISPCWLSFYNYIRRSHILEAHRLIGSIMGWWKLCKLHYTVTDIWHMTRCRGSGLKVQS